MHRIATLIAAAAMSLAALSAAQADRPPSMDERSRIEAALRAEGFIRWGEIELDEDDGVWEVDDAVFRDGTKFDLELTPEMRIIKREPD